jgi:hypothetical protein
MERRSTLVAAEPYADWVDLAADGSGAYYVEGSWHPGVLRQLLRVSPGSAPVVLVERQLGFYPPWVVGDSIYFDEYVPGSDDQLMRMPKTGGAPVALASLEHDRMMGHIVSTGSHLYWLSANFEAPYGELTSCILRRMPADGGEIEALGSCGGNPLVDTLAVSGGDLYWVDAPFSFLGMGSDTYEVKRLGQADRVAGSQPPYLGNQGWNPPVVGEPVDDETAGSALVTVGRDIFWTADSAVLHLNGQ